MLLSPILADPQAATWFLDAGDDKIRSALICWGMVLSAFIMLRIPREILLGCLIAAGATVGLAATAIDTTPEQAIASPRTSEVTSLRGRAAMPLRGPATNPPQRERRY